MVLQGFIVMIVIPNEGLPAHPYCWSEGIRGVNRERERERERKREGGEGGKGCI